MHDRERIAKEKPQGPFSPPLPKTAEKGGDTEPMAVAADKATIHGESFLPTSAPEDAFDHEVARKYARDVQEPRSEEETTAMQKPPGYSEPDEEGWAKLEEQQGEE